MTLPNGIESCDYYCFCHINKSSYWLPCRSKQLRFLAFWHLAIASIFIEWKKWHIYTCTHVYVYYYSYKHVYLYTYENNCVYIYLIKLKETRIFGPNLFSGKIIKEIHAQRVYCVSFSFFPSFLCIHLGDGNSGCISFCLN